MDQFIVKNKKFILGAILTLAAILIFTGLTRADIQGDDATYSYRSVGYIDYMNTNNRQSTPLLWFDEYPSWAKLSFHDHPPLVFIIQHLFFKFFGTSNLVAKLPFALAGLLSVLILFLLSREIYDDKIALLTSFILAIFSYHSWASKIGYLEPITTLMLLLTALFFFKGLKKDFYFLIFGLFLGLAALSKYTAFFIVPVFLIYLLIKNRSLFLNKNFIFGILLSLILFSPVIIYNIIMFQERGHFDLQWAILFDQDLADWPSISRSVGGFDFLGVFKVLFENMSIFLFNILMLSLGYLFYRFIKNIKSTPNLFLILSLVFSFVFFAFISPASRMLSVLLPFIAMVLAVFLSDTFDYVAKKTQRNYFKYLFIICLSLFFAFELFYNINTNLISNPVGQKGRMYSVSHLPSGGFNALEKYFFDNNIVTKYHPKKIEKFSDVVINGQKVSGKDMIIYDPDLNWFSTTWYFARHSIYNQDLFISAADLGSQISPDNWFDFFKNSGIINYYFIEGKNNAVLVSNQNKLAIQELTRIYQAMDAEEIDIISNEEVMFKIYKIKIN